MLNCHVGIRNLSFNSSTAWVWLMKYDGFWLGYGKLSWCSPLVYLLIEIKVYSWTAWMLDFEGIMDIIWI